MSHNNLQNIYLNNAGQSRRQQKSQTNILPKENILISAIIMLWRCTTRAIFHLFRHPPNKWENVVWHSDVVQNFWMTWLPIWDCSTRTIQRTQSAHEMLTNTIKGYRPCTDLVLGKTGSSKRRCVSQAWWSGKDSELLHNVIIERSNHHLPEHGGGSAHLIKSWLNDI